MRILIIDWKGCVIEDIISVLQKNKHSVKKIQIDITLARGNDEYEANLIQEINSFYPSYVFSFNYFPIISNVCMKCELPYISWVYDSPQILLFSYTIINQCNRVFVFDKATYQYFQNNGITTVHYLPLAANVERLESLPLSDNIKDKYSSEVSFVGSLYNEKKHNFYDEYTKNLSDYSKGYLKGIIESQKHVYGYTFVEELINDKLLCELQHVCPCPPNKFGVETDKYIYSNYFILRKVTSEERLELLSAIARNHQMHLYTHNTEAKIANIDIRGPVDYYDQMPYVFKYSKININISLRSIQSGIPLRAIDIMGAGGFLLSNYQEDFLDYFAPDEDFVYYDNYEDCLNKIDYYLTHDKDRKEIAHNGHNKIKQFHKYEDRLPILFPSL